MTLCLEMDCESKSIFPDIYVSYSMSHKHLLSPGAPLLFNLFVVLNMSFLQTAWDDLWE